MADPVVSDQPKSMEQDAAVPPSLDNREQGLAGGAGQEAAHEKLDDGPADDAGQADQPADEEAEEDVKSKRVTLADLSAKGTALYAHQNYEEAAELFSRASVLQAELNGETAPQNADILFHYGRSLFKVGQSKSDVLGGPAAQNGTSSSKLPASDADAKGEDEGKDKGNGEKESSQVVDDAKKPLFQFSGDENFDTADSQDDNKDDDQDAEDGAQEDDDDDLATAFEILDLARVCYLKQLDQFLEEENQSGKGKEVAQSDSSAVRHIKERLADTHDCLAEISLENERYPRAIEDGRVSLKYKMELYPEESEIVAEAHYKLSLALEFASVTVSDEEGTNTKREALDQDLRDEAIKEMELAIKSFKLKMQNREVDLATMASPEDNDSSRKAIAEMKEVVADMEQRLVDLRKDPIDASALLGAALGGGDSAESQARVEEATKKATDLTDLVRKKAKDDEGPVSTESLPVSKGKRKAEDDGPEAAESPKKAKLEES